MTTCVCPTCHAVHERRQVPKVFPAPPPIPRRCAAELREGNRWVRCGAKAEWYWPDLNWECCDKHCRYEVTHGYKKCGDLVRGVIPLSEAPPISKRVARRVGRGAPQEGTP